MAQSTELKNLIPDASKCTYTSCYCEENVWKLCEHVQKTSPEKIYNCYSMFISNENKQIPLWHQKSSRAPDGVVIWDYHVIFLYKDDEVSLVFDLDTKLPFPCDFVEYVTTAIRPNATLKRHFHRKFRVTQADKFLSTFASDRSHMLDQNKHWLSEPPTYPCIKTESSTNNIFDFISMDADVGVGSSTVLDYDSLVESFTVK